MLRRFVAVSIIIAAMLIGVRLVSAHANLARSEPLPNSILVEAPPVIRLWFTEPLEPDFSSIRLRDSGGNIVEMPASIVDPTDRFQMSLTPGDLPDGLYTVVWRALSAADGHPSQGSFAFIVGQAAGGFGTIALVEETIPIDGSLIRWVNLFSLSLAVGGLGFWMFVWRPAVSGENMAAERRMQSVLWLGWALAGVSGLLLLALQYALSTGNPLLTAIDGTVLQGFIADTRFGQIWLARMALWVGLGLSLYFARDDRWFLWVAFLLGLGLLLTNSLFSHASAARDSTLSIGADWLHLSATALWVGGLVALGLVIGPVRRGTNAAAQTLSALVGYFSNFARVSVIALIVTGIYASWLQVGSLEGLLTTTYGATLIIKLLLILPLIGLAGINLLVTGRELRAGNEAWGGKLRGLLGAEIVLTMGVLAAVGVMTSIAPSRTALDLRASQPRLPDPTPIVETLTNDDLNLELAITPGWVGDNLFTLRLTDTNGAPVEDANLIRMRFESKEQNLGESELRPQHQGEGIYTISGSNLSVPGEWRIRATVQRPDKFDALADFKPVLSLPTFITPPPRDPNIPLTNRTLVLLVIGLAALIIGGFFLGESRLRPPLASSLLAGGLVAVGLTFLIGGVFTTTTATSTTGALEPAPTPLPVGNAPIRVVAGQGLDLPYLITTDGDFLKPNADGESWSSYSPGAPVRDAYVDGRGQIWAATDAGSYTLKDSEWSLLGDQPVSRIEVMHGYVFALGNGAVHRFPAGGIELDRARDLAIPLPNEPAREMVMLGNHDHVLLNGDQLFLTPDLGLSWEPVETPAKATAIWVDAEGQLVAVTNADMLRWDASAKTWTAFAPIQNGDLRPTMQVFNNQFYAVSGGVLYRRAGAAWIDIGLPGEGTSILTGIDYQYPDKLWVLDAKGARLWWTTDGDNWTMLPVVVR